VSQITIMRTDKAWPFAAMVLDAIKDFLFGVIDGFNRDDKRAWRRIWKRIKDMEAGEMLVIDIRMPRSGPFHRRHMKIEQSVFDSQERFQNFKAFRDWVKIGAGHCEWVPGPKGAVVPIPNSISYASMDDNDFRVFHENMIQFLRGDHAANVLWPHLKGDRAADMMDAILQELSE
jgi:hypothetical protein